MRIKEVLSNAVHGVITIILVVIAVVCIFPYALITVIIESVYQLFDVIGIILDPNDQYNKHH